MQLSEAKSLYQRLKREIIQANNEAKFYRVQVLKEYKHRLRAKIIEFEQQNRT